MKVPTWMKDADIFGVLEAAVQRTTEFYQSDFDTDKRMLAREENRNKWFIWFARKCGTQCALLREAAIRHTPQNSMVLYYEYAAKETELFFVKPESYEDGVLRGSIITGSLLRTCEVLKRHALAIEGYTVTFEIVGTQERPQCYFPCTSYNEMMKQAKQYISNKNPLAMRIVDAVPGADENDTEDVISALLG